MNVYPTQWKPTSEHHNNIIYIFFLLCFLLPDFSLSLSLFAHESFVDKAPGTLIIYRKQALHEHTQIDGCTDGR